MRCANAPCRAGRSRLGRQGGFSLLEVLVAFAIMALALALLYQVLGSNIRAVGVTGEYQRAAILAQSLLNAHDGIPEQGWSEDGESGGFVWQVRSQPYVTPVQNQFPDAVALHEVQVVVSWQEGGQSRQMALATLRPQRTIESRGG